MTSLPEGGRVELRAGELYSTTWQLVPMTCLAAIMGCSALTMHAFCSCVFFKLSVATSTTRQLQKTVSVVTIRSFPCTYILSHSVCACICIETSRVHICCVFSDCFIWLLHSNSNTLIDSLFAVNNHVLSAFEQGYGNEILCCCLRQTTDDDTWFRPGQHPSEDTY